MEGGDRDVLKGAAEIIASTRRCVIAVEANPRIAMHLERDPVVYLGFLQSVRPFTFSLPRPKTLL